MDTHVDIRVPLKNGFRAVLSHPIFVILGALIAVPNGLGLAQFFALGGVGQGDVAAQLQGGEMLSSPWEITLLLLLAGVAVIFGSLGIVGLALLMNRRESGETLSLLALRKPLRYRTKSLVMLELFLIMLALLVESILSIPADIALSRGLARLSQVLSYSALGLFLSISLLLFFLRQYAALYLSLSNISVRSALENASGLFRLHIRETFLLSGSLFFGEIIVLLVVSEGFSFLHNFLEQKASPLFLSFEAIVEGTCVFGVLSLAEAWKWTSWTSFFRIIALPKDPEPVLQKSETVLQQESAVSLD